MTASAPRALLPESFQPADRVVIPVQGTDREFLAQQWAVEFAAALGVPICAVHVATGAESADVDEDELFAYVGEEAMKWGVPIETHVLAGRSVVDVVLDEVKPRDLIVIGTRRLGSAFHVGSVAAELVRRAPCPVQVVRIE